MPAYHTDTKHIGGRRRGAAASLAALLLMVSCAAVFAGGGRHNVLLVVNENSAVSRAIGEHYRAARKIPAANVCRIYCPTSESINSTDFKTAVLYPIENYLTAHNLVEQIQYIVLTKGIPLIVTTTGNSVDSSLTLAFQRWTDGVTPCIEGAGNPYLGKDCSFAEFRASEDNIVYWNDPVAGGAIGSIAGVAGDAAEPLSGSPYSVRLMYLVCRLDGYGDDSAGGGNGVPDDVEAMIAASLSPDATGAFVMDASTANYPAGNAMLARTADELSARGRSVLCDNDWGFVTGACPGLGPVAGYAGWGSNDAASKWNTEWAKPNFTWKPGSIAMCFVSTDGRSLDEPPAYLRCSANSIIDDGQGWDEPDEIRISNWVYSGWTASLHSVDGSVASSACFADGAICVPCPAPVEGYIQVYRPDGVTPVCGARFPASGTALLAGGRQYRLSTGQSLIADYLAEGCSGAIGSVSEPGFGYTWPEYTFPRYVDGFTWAESAWMGIAMAPWKFLVAGDPLMAPYATPPSVSLVQPGAGEAALRGIVGVEIAASDDKGVSKVELWVDDAFRGTASGAGPTYTIALDTASLADGLHSLEAIAYEAGAAATQGSVSRTVVTVNGNDADSVADLFDVPGGSWVYVQSAVVTRVFPSYGCFYAQEGRTAGIKVVSKQMPAEGDVVSAAGILHSGSGVERCIEAKALSILSHGSELPRPIGFTNRLLGGGSVRTASGITSPSPSRTLYNIGLLSTIWGRVISAGEDYFYMSDGSDEIGVRVMCHEFAPPFGVGELVRATGVSSMIAGYRALLVGKAADLRPVASSP